VEVELDALLRSRLLKYLVQLEPLHTNVMSLAQKI